MGESEETEEDADRMAGMIKTSPAAEEIPANISAGEKEYKTKWETTKSTAGDGEIATLGDPSIVNGGYLCV